MTELVLDHADGDVRLEIAPLVVAGGAQQRTPGVAGSSSASGNFWFMITAQSAMLLGSGASSDATTHGQPPDCRCRSKSTRNCAKLPRSGDAMLVPRRRSAAAFGSRPARCKYGPVINCDSTGEPRAGHAAVGAGVARAEHAITVLLAGSRLGPVGQRLRPNAGRSELGAVVQPRVERGQAGRIHRCRSSKGGLRARRAGRVRRRDRPWLVIRHWLMSEFDSSPNIPAHGVDRASAAAMSVTAFQRLTLAATTSPVIGSTASTMMPQSGDAPDCGLDHVDHVVAKVTQCAPGSPALAARGSSPFTTTGLWQSMNTSPGSLVGTARSEGSGRSWLCSGDDVGGDAAARRRHSV